jgi:hypothetical protein
VLREYQDQSDRFVRVTFVDETLGTMYSRGLDQLNDVYDKYEKFWNEGVQCALSTGWVAGLRRASKVAAVCMQGLVSLSWGVLESESFVHPHAGVSLLPYVYKVWPVCRGVL